MGFFVKYLLVSQSLKERDTKRPTGAPPRSSSVYASTGTALGPVGPKSRPGCDAAAIPAVPEDSLLLRFCVSEKRNVSSQWRKLRTDFVLVV